MDVNVTAFPYILCPDEAVVVGCNTPSLSVQGGAAADA